MEESFLLLEEKEYSRALNILQSSVNKLLHFVGDADIISASLSVSDAGLSGQENKSKQNLPTCSQDFQTGSRNGDGKKAAVRGRKKPACRPKKKATRRNGSAAFSNRDESGRNRSAESLFASATAGVQSGDVSRAAPSLQACEKAKHENKDNFDDDLQELADFDCTYDFNPNLQHTSSEAVSRAGVGHMTQCGGKFTGKMLSMSAGTSDENVCVTSGPSRSIQRKCWMFQPLRKEATARSPTRITEARFCPLPHQTSKLTATFPMRLSTEHLRSCPAHR